MNWFSYSFLFVFKLVQSCCLTPKTWVWPFESCCYHVCKLRYQLIPYVLPVHGRLLWVPLTLMSAIIQTSPTDVLSDPKNMEMAVSIMSTSWDISDFLSISGWWPPSLISETSDSISTRPVVLPNHENMGIAIEISLLSGIQPHYKKMLNIYFRFMATILNLGN